MSSTCHEFMYRVQITLQTSNIIKFELYARIDLRMWWLLLARVAVVFNKLSVTYRAFVHR